MIEKLFSIFDNLKPLEATEAKIKVLLEEFKKATPSDYTEDADVIFCFLFLSKIFDELRASLSSKALAQTKAHTLVDLAAEILSVKALLTDKTYEKPVLFKVTDKVLDSLFLLVLEHDRNWSEQLFALKGILNNRSSNYKISLAF